jgi:hypothetical protein
MPVPSDIQAALDQVQADAEATAAAKSAAADAQASLDAAQAAQAAAAQAVIDATAKQAADLVTLQQLLNAQYGPGSGAPVAAAGSRFPTRK